MTRAAAGTVIKVGGRAQQDPRLAPALSAYWARWRAASAATRSAVCCVVHGGGDEVTALQRAAGIEPTFIGGRRVTRADDIDRLRMALSGLANKRLVAALTQVGVRALGLSGEDGPLLTADVVAGGELGAVGTVRSVDTSLLIMLALAGYLPVIAPVAAARAVKTNAEWQTGLSDTAVSALNINGDDAATAIALAIGASEILFVSDVAGVRIDGERVSEMTPSAAERAIVRGEIAGGMVAKVRAALAALEGGATQVRIGTLDVLTGIDSGTLVVRQRDALAETDHAAHGAAA
jgi:acetylglutamate kinase